MTLLLAYTIQVTLTDGRTTTDVITEAFHVKNFNHWESIVELLTEKSINGLKGLWKANGLDLEIQELNILSLSAVPWMPQ